MTASILVHTDTYLEVRTTVKNLGASAHTVEQGGGTCTISAIGHNITEHLIGVLPVFTSEDQIEPGEAINDLILLKLGEKETASLWIRIDLRVLSGSVEWHQSELVRLEQKPLPEADFQGAYQ